MKSLIFISVTLLALRLTGEDARLGGANYSHLSLSDKDELGFTCLSVKEANLAGSFGEDKKALLLQELEKERTVKVPACTVVGQSKLSSGYLINFSEKPTLGERYKAIKQSIFSNTNPSFTFDLKKKPDDLLQIIEVASLSPFGVSKIKNLLLPYVEGSIKIKFISQEEMAKQSGDPDDPWGAEYDRESKTIYLNKDSELGVVVPSFIHELEHALDKEAAKSFQITVAMQKSGTEKIHELRKIETEVNRDKTDDKVSKIKADYEQLAQSTVFKTERRAYNAQFAFMSELKDKFLCFGPYLDAKSRNEEIISGYLSDDALVKNKDLDVDVLKESGIVIKPLPPEAGDQTCQAYRNYLYHWLKALLAPGKVPSGNKNGSDPKGPASSAH